MANHTSFKSLSDRLAKVAVQVEDNSVVVAKKATFAGLQAAVLATPVDEGTARSNWNVSVREPDTESTREAYVKGNNLGQGESQNANRAIVAGSDKIKQYKYADRKLFITNNLNYIGFLDQGSSEQAPQGMTQFALNAIAQVIKQAKLLKEQLKDDD